MEHTWRATAAQNTNPVHLGNKPDCWHLLRWKFEGLSLCLSLKAWKTLFQLSNLVLAQRASLLSRGITVEKHNPPKVCSPMQWLGNLFYRFVLSCIWAIHASLSFRVLPDISTQGLNASCSDYKQPACMCHAVSPQNTVKSTPGKVKISPVLPCYITKQLNKLYKLQSKPSSSSLVDRMIHPLRATQLRLTDRLSEKQNKTHQSIISERKRAETVPNSHALWWNQYITCKSESRLIKRHPAAVSIPVSLKGGKRDHIMSSWYKQ